MGKYERLFFCDKAIVLNAIYDALDAIGFSIDSANSGRGTLVVSAQTAPETKYRVALTPSLSAEQTSVEVFGKDEENAADDWIAALFDEMKAIMKKAGMEDTV